MARLTLKSGTQVKSVVPTRVLHYDLLVRPFSSEVSSEVRSEVRRDIRNYTRSELRCEARKRSLSDSWKLGINALYRALSYFGPETERLGPIA
jgi:hypothetical protein